MVSRIIYPHMIVCVGFFVRAGPLQKRGVVAISQDIDI